MLEAKVEAHLVKRVKAMGGEIRKVAWIGRAHAPDRFVFFPDQPMIGSFWAELKRPGLDAEDGQHREHVRMRKAGLRVFVLDTIDAVNEALDLITHRYPI